MKNLKKFIHFFFYFRNLFADPLFPEGLSAGTYSFKTTVTDDGGNSASYVISVTIRSESRGVISFGNYFLLISTLTIIGLTIIKKKKLKKIS